MGFYKFFVRLNELVQQLYIFRFNYPSRSNSHSGLSGGCVAMPSLKVAKSRVVNSLKTIFVPLKHRSIVSFSDRIVDEISEKYSICVYKEFSYFNNQ